MCVCERVGRMRGDAYAEYAEGAFAGENAYPAGAAALHVLRA